MAPSKIKDANDYTKEEDYMMWELHKIRHNMALENLSAKEINRRGKLILKEFAQKMNVRKLKRAK